MKTESEILHETKIELLRLRAQMTEVILNTSRQVAELAKHVKPRKVRAFLRTECGLPSSELSTYVGFAKVLGDDFDTLEKARISFPLAKALVAADEDTRHEALAQIAVGSTLDAKDIAAIRRRIRESRFAKQDLALMGRRAKVAKIAAASVRDINIRFETKLHALIVRIHDFYDRQMPLPDEDWTPNPEDPDYDGAVENICDKAIDLLAEFKMIYGNQRYLGYQKVRWQDFQCYDPSDPVLVIEKAWVALNRFADCQFGVNGGFAWDPDRNAFYSYDIMDALSELIADASVQPRTRVLPKPVLKGVTAGGPAPLKSLELCAGVGGMALGLQAAGFHHVGLFEIDEYASAALMKNQPSWPVFNESIRRDFTEFKGKVDVVSGGLPCQSFSNQGKMEGPYGKVDLFRDGLRIVKEIEPRAFLFENVKGFSSDKFSEYRAELLRGFESAGYETDAFVLDAQDFGLAQSRSRIFIVGMRRGELSRFQRPSSVTGVRANIGDALADLMAANGWSGAKEWSERFRQVEVEHRGQITVRPVVSPTVVAEAPPTAFESAVRTWRKVGIDPNGTASSAPTDAEAAKAGDSFYPRLTNRMRARLQGFPDAWEFVGVDRRQAKQIGNAVPPRLAKAVGLALRAALEGVAIDYQTALMTPEIDEALVGQPSPNRKRVNLNAQIPALDFSDDLMEAVDELPLSGRKRKTIRQKERT